MRPTRALLVHQSLLIILISALLFVRIVDLHWHQPLQAPAPSSPSLLEHGHLSDASAPQSEALVYADISITGDDGFSHQLPVLALPAGLLLISLLLLIFTGEKPLAPEQSSRTQHGWALLPPSHGPPATTL